MVARERERERGEAPSNATLPCKCMIRKGKSHDGGVTPDDKICSLVVNAYVMAGQSQKALIAFENMRRAGIKPSDKCIASVLVAYEKESKINTALEFLIDLERDGIMVEEEASAVLAKWFRKLGVVEEVELVLRDFVTSNQIS